MAKKKKTNDEFFDLLSKEVGEANVSTGTSAIEDHHGIKVPTGNPVLDLLTGGGYPVGLVVELAGKKSSGKSTMALLAVAEAQKLGGRVLYIDAEQTLSDPEQLKRARHLGVDLDSLYRVTPDTLEDGMFAMTRAMDLSKKEDIPFVLVVWDTIAFLPTKDEFEAFHKGSDKAGMAGARRAVQLRQYMRSMIQDCRKTKTCILSLAHLTATIGGYGPQQDTIPGGSAFQFGASMQIIMRASSAKDNQMRDEDSRFGDKGDYRGSLVVYKLEKTRLSPPKREVSAWLDVYSGIDKALTMLDYFIERDLAIKEGNFYVFPVLPEPLKISSGDKGREAFKAAFDSDPSLREQLHKVAQYDYRSVIPWEPQAEK